MADASTQSEGFTFAPPPLVLNGQGLAGGLNFNATNAVAQVDQASQAYDFINNLNAGAYNFLSGALSSTQQFAAGPFNSIISSLTDIGTGEVKAEQTAANSLKMQGCTGIFGCLF